uniref:Uncharacterized protein n=1 Tax=Arundo donax TaxID=35708 RepID=A0A0A8ZZR7_ARUDO
MRIFSCSLVMYSQKTKDFIVLTLFMYKLQFILNTYWILI